MRVHIPGALPRPGGQKGSCMASRNQVPGNAVPNRSGHEEGTASIRGRGTLAALVSSFVFPLVLTQFIASYAGSSMNVAITNIAEDLGTTTHGVQTAITLFTLTMAALMIPG